MRYTQLNFIRLLATTLLMAICCLHLSAQAQASDEVFTQQRIVPAPEFSPKRLELIGKEEAARHPGLLVVWFFVSKEEASLFWKDTVTMRRVFSDWVTMYDAATARDWSIGRYISFRGASVLQVRDKFGGVYRKSVSGDEILNVEEDGVFADIVHITRSAPTSTDPVPDLFLYARIHGPLDQAAANAIWRRFRGLNVRLISIVLRSDPWFAYNWGIPVFYPFDTSHRIPTEPEAANTRSVHCQGAPNAKTPFCMQMIGERMGGALLNK
ncbi:hypothetical protein [Paludibaculum fermentans]|uniref:Uncharacterized protein n=1 Tax=Paludibaculum fermentans TaxID=1473598 RepID=A0A7S7NRB2_PALFE|nr:hypothetical protein [Paludibaculum fermentans]QOY87869.1 hypothetical protein IRI77_34900 [Paludibaculum fermentans]